MDPREKRTGMGKLSFVVKWETDLGGGGAGPFCPGNWARKQFEKRLGGEGWDGQQPESGRDFKKAIFDKKTMA